MKKRNIILVVVLVALTTAFFLFRNKENDNKDLRFFNADSIQIGKISITTPEDTLVIVKQKDEWKIIYPIQWDVLDTKIRDFFKDVISVKTSTTPMSEDKSAQSLYGVDDKHAMIIKLYDPKGKLLDHAFIGAGNSAFQYGRKKGSNQIYQFGVNIYNAYLPDVQFWREMRVVKLSRSDIKTISVVYRKNSYVISNTPHAWHYHDKLEDFDIDSENQTVFKLLNGLENLSSGKFYDGKYDEFAKQFAEPILTVTITLKNGKTHRLTFISNDKENDFIMMLDDNHDTLFSMLADMINRFTRAAEAFREVDFS